MKNGMFVILVAGVLLTGGCAEYWYQEGKTFDQCQKDWAACQTEMAKNSGAGGPSLPYEHKFMANCMKDKGYKLVREGKLPLDVKRQASSATPTEIPNGIAGRVFDANSPSGAER